MVGSVGERMLRITLPHVDAWNAWYASFGNSPEGYRPVRARVDEACRAVGRDPAEVERMVALLVALPGATGGRIGDPDRPAAVPLDGRPHALADALRRFAAEGVAHVQLVLDPIDAAPIRKLAPALALLDAG
jgi:alkanesulfonate monooxygenase SsuD/methylene tetrahydromethanopterin reductase-like flavin-dependent oxidoreductase (luciferase family)